MSEIIEYGLGVGDVTPPDPLAVFDPRLGADGLGEIFDQACGDAQVSPEERDVYDHAFVEVEEAS